MKKKKDNKRVKSEKKKTRKVTMMLSTVAVVGLFSTATYAMISTGKIDVSNVPGVNKIYDSKGKNDKVNELTVDQLNANQDGNAYLTGAAAQEFAVMDNGTLGGGSRDSSNTLSVAKLSKKASEYTSISDVATDANGNIYAADLTGQKLYKLSSNGSILQTYSADDQVNGLYADGNYVYALEGELAGKVSVLDSNLSKIKEIEVGHTPVDMVVKGSFGYVVNRFSNTVSVIDLNNNTVSKTIDVEGREPDALCIAGNKLYVACHMPDEGSREKVMSSNVVVIDTATNTVSKSLNLINGADGVKGICASPDGRTVYVSHVIARYTYPTSQLDRGWINTNGFSIIDTGSDTVTTSMMLDEVDLGAANPWGVTVSKDGNKLIFALSGLDEVMVVDIPAMNNKINAVRNGSGVVSSMEDIPDYLPFLDDCRERISLSGKGARAVWPADNKVYVGLYFDGSIDVVDLSNKNVQNLRFVQQPENDDMRKGEIIFSDATLCYQKWQSCLSCHPDARVDGLNWDNLNDGLGNPKSAKSMLYSHRTPPTMSTGIRASAEIAVRAGMKYIQFNALDEEQMAYIDEYLKSLQPVASPYLNRDGTLTESAARGKEIFYSVGCATCHPAPLYTDLKLHTSKATSDTTSWENRKMDTTTLVESWRTAPYVFDGRFATMKEAIAFYAADKNLTEEQIEDLTNFVLSIGNEGEQYGVEQVITKTGDTSNINVLIPGGTIPYFTVRRQDDAAATTAIVTATLKSGDSQIGQVTKTIQNVAFNQAVVVSLDSELNIPGDLAAGSTLTISITDSNGNALASDYVLQY